MEFSLNEAKRSKALLALPFRLYSLIFSICLKVNLQSTSDESQLLNQEQFIVVSDSDGFESQPDSRCASQTSGKSNEFDLDVHPNAYDLELQGAVSWIRISLRIWFHVFLHISGFVGLWIFIDELLFGPEVQIQISTVPFRAARSSLSVAFSRSLWTREYSEG